MAVAVEFVRLARRFSRAVIYRAPDELEVCPACESARLVALGVHQLAAPLAGRRTGLISGCEECGLVFVNPVPSADALAAMYTPQGEWGLARVDEESVSVAASGGEREKGERDKVERDKGTGIAEGAEAVASGTGSATWPRLFDAIRGSVDVTRPPAGSRVLDFGCGRGKFLDVLKPCGWDTFGIEPAMNTAFSSHQRLVAVPKEPTFDLVIAHHVLEHVTNPLELLRQFAAATRMGGHLLVAVPRLDTLPLHRDYRYVLSRVHVTAYTSTCMESLLMRAGWQLVERPHDEVAISGGRRTSARLRMLARRVSGEMKAPAGALRPAEAALRAYYAEAAPRPLLERLGAIRLSARTIESRRRLKRWAGVLKMATQHVAR